MKIRYIIILFLSGSLLFAVLSCSTGKLRIISTTCNNKSNPLGVSPGDLTFGWKMMSGERNILQTAYRMVIFAENKKRVLWDSGKTESDNNIRVNYGGPELSTGSIFYWKVRVWDNQGNVSGWSKISQFVTGLTGDQDWSGAKWIGYDELDTAKRIVPGIHVPGFIPEWRNKPSGNHVIPILRKEFKVKPGLKHALVFVSGLGQYELNLNGNKVGDHFMAPGWTDYDSLCFYNVFDITKKLRIGRNTFGMWLGNGFYNIPNTLYRKLIIAYGNPKMILKLELVYHDGRKEEIVSDKNWKTTAGPITFSSIYAGETFNANLEQPRWNKHGFKDSAWKDALVVKAPCSRLEAEDDYPVKVMERMDVKNIIQTDSLGKVFLYDFGQNASGIVEIKVKGNMGDTIRLVPAELIDVQKHAVQNATGKPYYLTYILDGKGTETWEPRFTYYGFRYIQVEGARPGNLKSESKLPEIKEMTFLHTRNSSPQMGDFHTSDTLFSRINQLIKWAVKSNIQSVVTDCPHREKLGWLEQTHLMGNSIHYNYDIYSLCKKQINDMKDAQFVNGMIPTTAPEYTRFQGGFLDTPEWGSAAVILPWLVYQWNGDPVPMEKAWSMMTRYLDYLKSKSQDHILDYGLGDWYDQGPNAPGFAQLTPVKLTATAIYYYDVRLMAQMAKVLGKEADSQRYSAWAEEIKAAFNREFLNPENNIYSSGSQTAIAMPLVVGLVDADKREAVFQTLVQSVNNSGKALTAGDVGFHYLVKALSDGGAGELL